MKIAAPFPLNQERQKKIDEYNVTFKIGKHKVEDFITWIQKEEVQQKRINVKFSFPENLKVIDEKFLTLMNNLHSNIYIRVAPQQNLLLNFCQEKKVKFFLDYDYNINNFCRLKNAIDQGVSDVYIMEDLCYHLPRVKELCDKNNVKIRCILNLIPSFTLGREEDPTSTFYVPENLDVLKTFYNVFEFELFDSWSRFDTLYKIWIERKEWKDELKFINFELNINIIGEHFQKDLCEYKMKCGHRCIEHNSPCRKCYQYIEIAQFVASKEREKKEKWVEKSKDEPIKDIF